MAGNSDAARLCSGEIVRQGDDLPSSETCGGDRVGMVMVHGGGGSDGLGDSNAGKLVVCCLLY
jgi:hypothetical protein